ncbi:MAG: GcvT family protein [Alphaproteobacteria bacterium]|nr:GcvT family protein [Alphaproteobacteria bacterium]
MAEAVPASARAVIVGGGIAGCSVAYHLAKLGWKDIVLVERARLTAGTTWHAAGLVGAMRPNRALTAMSKYGIDLYSKLEAETGQATGWKNCGSVNVARTPERVVAFKRQVALAKGFGVDIQEISPDDAGKLWPLMRTDDLQGAIWLPGDGKANPADLCMALAKGARQMGAKLFEGVAVTGFERANGSIVAVQTDKGRIAADVVVLACGQWTRQVGEQLGVAVPLHSAEHFYIVTKKIAGVTPDLPVMRDPDGYIYYKEEVGGLVMGGFEPVAKPWGMDGVPEDFAFQLLPEDWDQFQILMENALHRTPCLETAEVRQLLNGPESFTPDGNFILGEAPALRGLYVCAGFNSAGIANAGGAGRLTAEWIAGGEAPMDLADVDIRRFADFQANGRFLRERTVESLGLHYVMRWPRMELESARPLRRSPLYDRLAANGARFGSKMGWERANYFAPLDAKIPYAWTPNWLPYTRKEQEAARNGVGIIDQASFAKILIQGRDAAAYLQRICANDIDVAPGRSVYTALLNERGGFESDVTIARLAEDKFLYVTGSAQLTRDLDWLGRQIGDQFVTLTDATVTWTTLSLIGPGAEAALAKISPRLPKLANGEVRMIDVGLARVLATPMSYVGAPGMEMLVPTEYAAGVYDELKAATPAIADIGYYALDAMRIEAGRRAFGPELGPDETPVEAGLLHAVAFDKPGGFLGREALLAKREAGVAKRLCLFALEDAGDWCWGGEGILANGRPAGEISSAGWSTVLGRCVAMGYVRAPENFDRATMLSWNYEIDIAGKIVKAKALPRAPYPPK